MVVGAAIARRLTFFAAVAAFAVAVAVVWVFAAHSLRRGDAGLRSTLQPTSIAWGDRVFSDRASIARWLRARGISYAGWARRNPSLASTIDPAFKARHRAAPASRPSKRRAPRAVPASPAAARRFPSVPTSSLLLGALCLAAVLLALWARTRLGRLRPALRASVARPLQRRRELTLPPQWAERLERARWTAAEWVYDSDGNVRGDTIAVAASGVIAVTVGLLVGAVL